MSMIVLFVKFIKRLLTFKNLELVNEICVWWYNDSELSISSDITMELLSALSILRRTIELHVLSNFHLSQRQLPTLRAFIATELDQFRMPSIILFRILYLFSSLSYKSLPMYGCPIVRLTLFSSWLFEIEYLDGFHCLVLSKCLGIHLIIFLFRCGFFLISLLKRQLFQT